MRVAVRGTWPDPVVLRRGWARAEARPWNRSVPAAQLRLVRGAAPFLADTARAVLGIGAAGVLSPPVPFATEHLWRTAGFSEYARLVLLALDLTSPPVAPAHRAVPIEADGWEDVIGVDTAAFAPFWRFDRAGLAEALRATPAATLLGTVLDADLAGFAVVGVGGAYGYLQRVAVHPRFQRRGVGRSLTRAGAAWARSRGARALLLNTQPDNHPALDLYESEGFFRRADRLHLYGLEMQGEPGPVAGAAMGGG